MSAQPNDEMAVRDPREDPKPGDEISRNIKQAREGIIFRTVTKAHGGFVFFRQDNGWTAKPRIISLKVWRGWAAEADVYEQEVPFKCSRMTK